MQIPSVVCLVIPYFSTIAHKPHQVRENANAQKCAFWFSLHLSENFLILWGIRLSQWPRGRRRRSAAAPLLRVWVRIPPGAWMSVYYECCVLSRRGLCDELITRPEESWRLWCVVVCDLETSLMRRQWPTGDFAPNKKRRNSARYDHTLNAHILSCDVPVILVIF